MQLHHIYDGFINEFYVTVFWTESSSTPHLLAGPSNVSKIQGDMVVLECAVGGMPNPTIEWSRKGILILKWFFGYFGNLIA